MSEVLYLIHQDHENMLSLLDLLEGELPKIRECDEYDFAIIYSIVEYFSRYPDEYHHPFEDLVFEWIRKQRPQLSSLVNELLAEHTEQRKHIRNLVTMVAKFRADESIRLEELGSELESFAQFERGHIDKEERGLLQEAEDLLSGLHIKEIPIPDRSALDPLFEDPVDPNLAVLAAALRGTEQSPSGAK